MVQIGIDLGGTKTELVALGSGGEVVYRSRRPTPSHSYEEIVQNIAKLVEECEAQLGTGGTVGVGIPGTISRQSGLVKNANTTIMIGKPLPNDLAAVLKREVRIANDANCFALSEAKDGAGAGAQVVFGVIIGTGCGGGVVVGGQVLEGVNSIAGEWGHNRLPDASSEERPGATCYCGHQGCIETFISGPAMAADHLKVTGEKLSTHEIYQRFKSGEAGSQATFMRYAKRAAKSLAGVINVLDPEVIVLGGGMSNMDELYEIIPTL